jgi:hypothetical protein
MPTLLRLEGYRFFFFSNEAQEPPHIHVAQAERYAKFWLEPVALARNRGFRRSELTWLEGMVQEHRGQFLKVWHGHFAR